VRRDESDLVGPIAGLVLTESATQRIEDGQTLSHQAGGHLAEPLGAVEDCQVCPRQALGGLLDDFGQLVDQHPVQGHPVVRGRRLGLDLHLLSVGDCQNPDAFCLRLGRLDDLRDQLLLTQLGGALSQLGPHREDFSLGLRLGQRSRLGGFGLRFVDFGLVLSPHDRRLPRELGLVALRLLLGLGRGLIGLRLSNLRLLLNGRVVRRGHRQDVPQ